MASQHIRRTARVSLTLFSCLPFLLTGCALQTTALPGVIDSPAAISGQLHGGQQPISGARVYLFSASSSGYGTPSVSLLSQLSTGLHDTIGAYVLSDANGNFSLSSGGTRFYNCPIGEQLYILALGGNPGLAPAVNNTSLALMASLGGCANLTTSTFVSVNEVTTVAAAYALSGFMTDTTHVAFSGSGNARSGVSNAMALSAALTDSHGLARSTTPAGNGIIPAAEINTLANILAACINTDGAITGPANPTPCYTLFNNAKNSANALPTDTIGAVLNIAHAPAANVAALFGLSSATAPFQPTLLSAPANWTLAITYTTTPSLTYPLYLAVDGVGGVWIADCAQCLPTPVASQSIYNLSALGVQQLAITKPGEFFPGAPAVDTTADIWLSKWSASGGATSIDRITPAGISTSGFPLVLGSLTLTGTAIDADGNGVFQSSSSTSFVGVIASNGSTVATSNGTGAQGPGLLAIDQLGLVWYTSAPVVGNNGGTLSAYVPANASSIYNASKTLSQDISQEKGVVGITGPAIDSSGNIWTIATGGILELPSPSFVTPKSLAINGMTFSGSIAVDGAGNVWAPNCQDPTHPASINFCNRPPFNNTTDGIFEISSALVLLSPATGYTTPLLSGPYAIAIDNAGNLWATNLYGHSITEFVGLATPVATPSLPITHGLRP